MAPSRRRYGRYPRPGCTGDGPATRTLYGSGRAGTTAKFLRSGKYRRIGVLGGSASDRTTLQSAPGEAGPDPPQPREVETSTAQAVQHDRLAVGVARRAVVVATAVVAGSPRAARNQAIRRRRAASNWARGVSMRPSCRTGGWTQHGIFTAETADLRSAVTSHLAPRISHRPRCPSVTCPDADVSRRMPAGLLVLSSRRHL